jgi:hypothetical protein
VHPGTLINARCCGKRGVGFREAVSPARLCAPAHWARLVAQDFTRKTAGDTMLALHGSPISNYYKPILEYIEATHPQPALLPA